MSLLLNAEGAAIADAYLTLADDAALPAGAAVMVSLSRWQADEATLLAHDAPVAVRLPNTADVGSLSPALLARPLLVLDFPGFADGRAYSQASLLKRRGYTGRLRAAGAAAVTDQLLMMRRSGIDEFALRGDVVQEAASRALAQSWPEFYQPTVRSSGTVAGKRN